MRKMSLAKKLEIVKKKSLKKHKKLGDKINNKKKGGIGEITKNAQKNAKNQKKCVFKFEKKAQAQKNGRKMCKNAHFWKVSWRYIV